MSDNPVVNTDIYSHHQYETVGYVHKGTMLVNKYYLQGMNNSKKYHLIYTNKKHLEIQPLTISIPNQDRYFLAQ